MKKKISRNEGQDGMEWNGMEWNGMEWNGTVGRDLQTLASVCPLQS